MSRTQKHTGSFLVFVAVVAVAAGGAAEPSVASTPSADEPPAVRVEPLPGVDSLPGFDPLQGFDPLHGFDPTAGADPPSRQSAVASDLEPASAAAVAREILQLQQQLGGSVVTDRADLQGWSAPASPVTAQPPFPAAPKWSPYPPHGYRSGDFVRTASPDSRVTELREAAWQLDSTAHGLEKLDLYEQADALRSLAQRLRQDARQMNQVGRAAADRTSK